jgi:SulP family sulfate permease
MVTVVVWTHNLALGVGVGVLLSALSFARKVAKIISVTSEYEAETQTRSYVVRGQLFFASAPDFVAGFDFSASTRRARRSWTGSRRTTNPVRSSVCSNTDARWRRADPR